MRELFPSENLLLVASDSAKKNPDKITPSSLEAKKIWEYICEDLKLLLSDVIFEKWIFPIKAQASNEDELILIVPSVAFYQTILNDYLEVIERCKNKLGFEHISTVIDLDKTSIKLKEKPKKQKLHRMPTLEGPPVFNENFSTTIQTATIQIKADEDVCLSQDVEAKSQTDNSVELRKTEPIFTLKKDEYLSNSANSDTLFSHTLLRKIKLNPHYTFETFVRGPSNQFALAACYNVAENPGKTYNPLFIYGATGLGKTHLLHAVGNHMIKTNSNATVAYVSSERFMNELIYCLRHNKIIDFRQKYRHCDLFLMDDIQFISGNKAATQEEFFHTFNTLYEAKKQIIITSDLFPKDIPDIEERLRNRFQWGLIADIQPPDIEHRIAILYSKAEQLGIRLTIDVAEYIANLVKRNVRELEGALHRLAAFAALHGRSLDKSLAIETFSNVLSEESAKPQMLIDSVQKVVAEHFQIKMSELKSKRRHKALTLPRQVAMYLSRKFTKTSYPEIGEKFGGKDHTTVIHAVRKITLERKKNMDLMVHLDTLERLIERLN
jgi:chromosomal replication initiator protein